MHIIHASKTAKEVADRWYKEYLDNNAKKDPRKIEIFMRLKDLPKDATPEQINEVIGNDSWTTISAWCSECDVHREDTMFEIGHIPDYESATAWLCVSCAEKFVALVKENQSNDIT